MKVAVIEVKRTGEGDPLEFAVIVRVGDGETRHHVTMVRDTCERLTAGTHTPERCIEAACEFLLDREPKEVAAPVRRLFPRGDQVVPQSATSYGHGQNCNTGRIVQRHERGFRSSLRMH